MLAEKENKEIKRAINTLDFLSKDPKERERHNSIVMAEYNRLVSEHNFFNDGLEKGMKKRKKRRKNRNCKKIIKNEYTNKSNYRSNRIIRRGNT